MDPKTIQQDTQGEQISQQQAVVQQQIPQQPIPNVGQSSSTFATPMAEMPTNRGSKKILILIILLILIIGMVIYVFVAKNQLKTAQKSSINTAIVPTIPAIKPTTTPASVEEINIASPDADLNGIEKDVLGL